MDFLLLSSYSINHTNVYETWSSQFNLISYYLWIAQALQINQPSRNWMEKVLLPGGCCLSTSSGLNRLECGLKKSTTTFSFQMQCISKILNSFYRTHLFHRQWMSIRCLLLPQNHTKLEPFCSPVDWPNSEPCSYLDTSCLIFLSVEKCTKWNFVGFAYFPLMTTRWLWKDDICW